MFEDVGFIHFRCMIGHIYTNILLWNNFVQDSWIFNIWTRLSKSIVLYGKDNDHTCILGPANPFKDSTKNKNQATQNN